MRIEVGLLLSQFRTKWKYLAADARAGEGVGLDSVWLADHLLGPAGSEVGAFEAWTGLAFVAAITSRVRLGHLVNAVSYRNVGLLAKMAATVDHASDGRLELGLGAGWFEEEYRAFGYHFPSPGKRRRAATEAVEALDLLFTGQPVDYDGEFVQLRGAVCQPPPVQQPRPPVTIGTGGPMMLRMTGEKADTWNCPASALPRLDAARAVVQEAAGGRRVRTTIQVPAAVGRTRQEAEAALDVGKAHMAWMGDVERIGIVGTLDEAAERVAAYRERGVDGFLCVVPGSPRRPDFIEALGELRRSL